MEWTVMIPGRPAGKPRPRPGQGGKFWTPEVASWGAVVVQFTKAAGVELHDGPVELDITIYRKMADGWPKWRKEWALDKPCMAVPDTVNVSALIHDVLQGLAYHDDKQVAFQRTQRWWSDRDETVLKIRHLEGIPDRKP